MSKDNNTYNFNFYGNVGQNIAHVDKLETHFDKDANLQIANVENAEIKQTSQPKPCTKTKTATTTITSATFHYVYFEQHSALIAKLFQGLLSLNWIAADSNPDAFMELFAGKESNCKIKWIGTRQHLAYLFNLLTERKYITIPKGANKWVIVCSHFVDKNSRQFINMNKLSKPKKAEKAIDMLAEALNPASTINKAES